MRMETIVMIVVVIGLTFTIVGLMANDLKKQYPETNVENFTGKYDYTQEISEKSDNIVNYFNKIGNAESGWQILTGIAAFPFAVIEAVSLILTSLTSGVSIVTGLGTETKIDPVVLSFIVLMITITIIFALIKFWRKTETIT